MLSHARRVLARRVRRGATMSSPQAVKDPLRLEIGGLEHEVFCVLFLDAQHRIIALKQMYRSRGRARSAHRGLLVAVVGTQRAQRTE